MSALEASNAATRKRFVFPRWLAPIYFAVVLPLVLFVAPWGLSLLSPRYGSTEDRPSLLNLFPLILVAAGVGCAIWTIVLHCVQAPEGWEMERTPKYLLIRGPYRFSRNPSYLSLLIVLLGWSLFYGSVAVLVLFIVAAFVLHFVAAPKEERDLEARFGAAYLQYKNTVPRWFGKLRL